MRDSDWERFIERSIGGYISTALKYTKSFVEAEDLVWGVYANLLEKDYLLKDLPTIGLKSVHNAGVNLYRYKGLRWHLDLDKVAHPSFNPSTEAKIDHSIILDSLPDILPPKQLATITAYIDKDNYKKAAAVVGTGVNTFKTNIHKARLKIRNEFPEYNHGS